MGAEAGTNEGTSAYFRLPDRFVVLICFPAGDAVGLTPIGCSSDLELGSQTTRLNFHYGFDRSKLDVEGSTLDVEGFSLPLVDAELYRFDDQRIWLYQLTLEIAEDGRDEDLELPTENLAQQRYTKLEFDVYEAVERHLADRHPGEEPRWRYGYSQYRPESIDSTRFPFTNCGDQQEMLLSRAPAATVDSVATDCFRYDSSYSIIEPDAVAQCEKQAVIAYVNYLYDLVFYDLHGRSQALLAELSDVQTTLGHHRQPAREVERLTEEAIRLRIAYHEWNANAQMESVSYHRDYQTIHLQFHHIFHQDELAEVTRDCLSDIFEILGQLSSRVQNLQQSRTNFVLTVLAFAVLPQLIIDLWGFWTSRAPADRAENTALFIGLLVGAGLLLSAPIWTQLLNERAQQRTKGEPQ